MRGPTLATVHHHRLSRERAAKPPLDIANHLLKDIR